MYLQFQRLYLWKPSEQNESKILSARGKTNPEKCQKWKILWWKKEAYRLVSLYLCITSKMSFPCLYTLTVISENNNKKHSIDTLAA